VYKGHDKFYARNSAGKYALDVTELRDAFLRTSAAGERMRSFRDSRLLEIAADRTPVPMRRGTKLAVHFMPLEAFATRSEFDVSKFYYEAHRLRLLGSSGASIRITVDGVVAYSGEGSGSSACTQLYRGGVVEALNGYIANQKHQDRQLLPSVLYERRIVEAVTHYLGLLRELGVTVPIYVCVSLVNAKGLWLGADDLLDATERFPLDRDILALPEAAFLNFDDDVAKTLKPTFDMMWNAFGYPASRNFDTSGAWKFPVSG